MSRFEPQLTHNRVAAEQLLIWKRALAIVAVPLLVSIVIVLPAELSDAAFVAGGIVVLFTFGYLEIRRALIFQRDVRERKEGSASVEMVEPEPCKPAERDHHSDV